MNKYYSNNENETVAPEQNTDVASKISESAKKIYNDNSIGNIMKRNNVSTPAMLIGMGLGVALSIKYQKSLLLMTVIGGVFGLVVGNILITKKIINQKPIENGEKETNG